MNLQTLKTEITTDPNTVGYSQMDDSAIADSLNAPGPQVDRDSITGGEIASAVDLAEWKALTNVLDREYVTALMSVDSIPLTQNFKQNVAGLFGAGSETRANLLALLKRTGSRAEELGLGRVTPSDVANARRLP